jgi:squid-like protein
MNAGEHIINGKRVDPKKAKARSGKIFVGGLPQDTTEETIRSFFGTFGNVISPHLKLCIQYYLFISPFP